MELATVDRPAAVGAAVSKPPLCEVARAAATVAGQPVVHVMQRFLGRLWGFGSRMSTTAACYISSRPLLWGRRCLVPQLVGGRGRPRAWVGAVDGLCLGNGMRPAGGDVLWTPVQPVHWPLVVFADWSLLRLAVSPLAFPRHGGGGSELESGSPRLPFLSLSRLPLPSLHSRGVRSSKKQPPTVLHPRALPTAVGLLSIPLPVSAALLSPTRLSLLSTHLHNSLLVCLQVCCPNVFCFAPDQHSSSHLHISAPTDLLLIRLHRALHSSPTPPSGVRCSLKNLLPLDCSSRHYPLHVHSSPPLRFPIPLLLSFARSMILSMSSALIPNPTTSPCSSISVCRPPRPIQAPL